MRVESRKIELIKNFSAERERYGDEDILAEDVNRRGYSFYYTSAR